MIYVIYFSDFGTPKTGLSPTVDIHVKVSDGSSAGSAPSVSVLRGGFYKFTATPTERVALRVDSEDSNMADADRYIPMVIGPEDDAMDFMKNIEGGKWQITGNQMIFYKSDNTTEVCRFNLFDSDGDASMVNVFKRERV